MPLVGTWLVSLLFGGEFPGPDLIERLFVLHALLLPVVIGLLITVHLAILVRQGARAFFITTAVLKTLGGLAQFNPVWLYGPFNPAEVSSYSQPHWYMGWLEGALRLMPSWEMRALGYEVPNPFVPGVLLPALTFALLYLWPFPGGPRVARRAKPDAAVAGSQSLQHPDEHRKAVMSMGPRREGRGDRMKGRR